MFAAVIGDKELRPDEFALLRSGLRSGLRSPILLSKVGAAIALALAAKGCRVVISDINVQGGKKLESDLGGTSKCFFVKADISQATERANLVKDGQKWAMDTAIAGKESRDTVISILVNNVGVQHVDPVENFPLERWQLIQDLMLTAPFHLSQMCLPDIYKLGYGRIINIGSIHSLVASVGKAAYVSAKHGLLGLTKTIALEAAQHSQNITANCICPSYVETPLVTNQLPALARTHGMSEDETLKKVLLANVPQGRLIKPAEVGVMAAYLCADEASAVTGAALQIDCGWTAR